MKLEDELAILLNRRQWQPDSNQVGVVPLAVEQQYARVGSALALAANHFSGDKELIVAVLTRASITDPEHEVRRVALEALASIHDSPEAKLAFVAATFDEEGLVREVAIELLWNADQVLARRISQRLLEDPYGPVRQYAKQIMEPEV